MDLLEMVEGEIAHDHIEQESVGDALIDVTHPNAEDNPTTDLEANKPEEELGEGGLQDDLLSITGDALTSDKNAGATTPVLGEETQNESGNRNDSLKEIRVNDNNTDTAIELVKPKLDTLSDPQTGRPELIDEQQTTPPFNEQESKNAHMVVSSAVSHSKIDRLDEATTPNKAAEQPDERPLTTRAATGSTDEQAPSKSELISSTPSDEVETTPKTQGGISAPGNTGTAPKSENSTMQKGRNIASASRSSSTPLETVPNRLQTSDDRFETREQQEDVYAMFHPIYILEDNITDDESNMMWTLVQMQYVLNSGGILNSEDMKAAGDTPRSAHALPSNMRDIPKTTEISQGDLNNDSMVGSSESISMDSQSGSTIKLHEQSVELRKSSRTGTSSLRKSHTVGGKPRHVSKKVSITAYETSEMTAPFPTTPFILDSHPDTAASKQRRASNRPTSKEAGNSDNPLLDHTNSDINEEFGVSQMIVELRQRLDQVVLERDEARTQAHKLHAVVEEMRSRLSMFEEKDKLSTSKILERVVEPWKSRTDKAEHLAKRLLEENERLRNKQTKLLGKALDIKLKLKDQTHEIASGSLPPHIHPYSLSTPPARGPTNATYSRKPLSSRVAGLAGPTGAAPPMAVLVEIATTLLGQSGTIQNSSNSAKATASSLIGSKYETLPAIPGAEREKTV